MSEVEPRGPKKQIYSSVIETPQDVGNSFDSMCVLVSLISVWRCRWWIFTRSSGPLNLPCFLTHDE